ncbi:tryptophanyl-tRNA synthetase [Melissococcus plutonius DAT561]|uniref:Uncharacterized protein n=1 Tax=Melissococcus plutonius TaxID=33970 RepID=A0A2Z5Y1X6_9ENTE|nr:tryptophanyl-tRNA synthetase [Melissococcus plutonius DAT561]BBC60760.1 hypothetical protein DAT561_0639 [Melissococcus plutonius]
MKNILTGDRPTDNFHIRVKNPGQVEGKMVFTYLDVFGKDKEYIEELGTHYRRSVLEEIIKTYYHVFQEYEVRMRSKTRRLMNSLF